MTDKTFSLVLTRNRLMHRLIGAAHGIVGPFGSWRRGETAGRDQPHTLIGSAQDPGNESFSSRTQRISQSFEILSSIVASISGARRVNASMRGVPLFGRPSRRFRGPWSGTP